MKLTKSKLKQIIKEELRKVLIREQALDHPLDEWKPPYGFTDTGADHATGQDPNVAPEVFKRYPEWMAREKECADLVYRRLEKLGDDTCMTTNICADVFRSACAQWRTTTDAKPPQGARPGLSLKSLMMQHFLNVLKNTLISRTKELRY